VIRKRTRRLKKHCSASNRKHLIIRSFRTHGWGTANVTQRYIGHVSIGESNFVVCLYSPKLQKPERHQEIQHTFKGVRG